MWTLEEGNGEDVGVRSGFEVAEERGECAVPADTEGVVPSTEEWIAWLQLERSVAEGVGTEA